MVYYGLKVARTEDLVSLAAFNLTNSQFQRRKKKEKKCFGKIDVVASFKLGAEFDECSQSKTHLSGNNDHQTRKQVPSRLRNSSGVKKLLDGVTTKCELQSTTSPDGHILNVIDTPGLFGFSPGPTETIEEISRCINFAKNGIHAILFVLSIKNRFSKEEEEEAVRNLQTHFGEKQFVYFMIVVFTHGDLFKRDDNKIGVSGPNKSYTNEIFDEIKSDLHVRVYHGKSQGCSV
ncbi:immune-associated nucleotide-binding protein 12-like [Papaver somniferum]|uniref:immune-associated nucleotide-binding protein 12-like n=1 Tax=Papaver somniferum TaxID=3469 RepID=UPI000E6FE2F3|nr:immune-associated nucleotide-binding protein 12-like [Papaver somniferum]